MNEKISIVSFSSSEFKKNIIKLFSLSNAKKEANKSKHKKFKKNEILSKIKQVLIILICIDCIDCIDDFKFAYINNAKIK